MFDENLVDALDKFWMHFIATSPPLSNSDQNIGPPYWIFRKLNFCVLFIQIDCDYIQIYYISMIWRNSEDASLVLVSDKRSRYTDDASLVSVHDKRSRYTEDASLVLGSDKRSTYTEEASLV